jgi:hypothetical protein
MAATTSTVKNPAFAQDNEIFRVVVGFFGINITEHEDDHIVAFVTVNNITQAKILNTTKLDAADEQDGIIQRVPFSFPNVTVNAGAEFRVCALLFQNLEDVCRRGYDSPINKVEYIGLSLQDAKAD